MPSTFPITRTAAEPRLSNVLAWEHEYEVSRETVVVLAGGDADRVLDLGQVLGRITKGVPVIAPAGGNTGNGALGALTLGSRALLGDYSVTCFAKEKNAARFAVIGPDGRRLADAKVGVPYVSPDLNFTITAHDRDWALGDSFTITLPPGSGKVVAIDFAATDGSQDAYGFLTRPVTAPAGDDAPGQAVVRDAIAVDGGLVWPPGATADLIAQALAQLEAARIHTRQEG